MPRPPAGLTLLVLLASCSRPAPVAPPPPEAPPATEATDAPGVAQVAAELKKLAWTAHSREAKVTVRQTPVAPGKCVVESSGPTPWKVERCLGDSMLLRFVSPDGEQLLAIDPLPVGVGDAWATAPVVTLYTRGVETLRTNAGALVADEDRLRRFTRHFAWVRGAGGTPGGAPGWSSETVVGGATVDGRAFSFGFDGSGIPPAVSGPPPRRTPRATGAPRVELPARPGVSGVPGAAGPQVAPQTVPVSEKVVTSICTYAERTGSRNFFMCIRLPPAQANGLCSSEMSAQYESRIVCSCSEDIGNRCKDILPP